MKDAIISIKGLIGTDEDGEDIEFVTGATYSFDKGSTSIDYQETELTGMGGTRTHFTIEPASVMITRSGTVNLQMLFEEGRKHYFNYNTPYGNMTMGVDTQSIKNELTETGGRLEVRYLMDLGSAMVTRNKFEINIKA